MSGQKKSIDEIWKELNATKPKPRQGIAGLAVGLSGLPGITSVVRSKQTSAPATAQSAASDKLQTCSTAGPFIASTVGDDTAAYLASLQRTINCLADPDRGLRRTAATALRTKLFAGDASTPKASPIQLQELLCGPLLRPLVAMLSDSVERCRTVALGVLLDGSHQVEDVSPMLPELVPELARRFGALPVQEPAEEVRLQIAQLTVQLLAAAPPMQLARFVPDLAAVVCRSLEDGFPDIKKAGCTAIETAAARVPFDSLAPEMERLINSLAPNLQHQHSRVRLSSIQALDALVAAGAPMALVEGTVATALRPVGHDRAQPVREAAFTALAHWMGYRASGAADVATSAVAAATAGDAAVKSEDATATGGAVAAARAPQAARSGHLPPQAYAASLLPLLIIGITDPHPTTADLALRLVEGVGEAWAAAATAYGGDVVATAAPETSVPRVQELTDPAVVVQPSPEQPGGSLTSVDAAVAVTAVSAAAAAGPLLPVGGAAAAASEERGGAGGDGSGPAEGSSTGEPVPSGRTAAAAAAARARARGGAEDEDAAMALRVEACRLGPPYQGRPGAGCRAMVRTLLAQHLPQLVRQLGEWTSALRVAAARALHTTLVLAEDGASRHLKLLLPALCSAIADDELEVASHVMAAVHVLGAHAAPEDWLPRILDILSGPPGGGGGTTAAPAPAGAAAVGLSLSQRTHTLVVLSGLLYAAGRARRELPPPLLARLAAVLADESMLTAAAEHSGVRQQLRAVVVNTLALGGGACAPVALSLHVLLLQLYGSELAAATPTPPSPAATDAARAPPAAAVAVLNTMASLATATCGHDNCNGSAAAADGAASLVDLHFDALVSLLFGDEAAATAAASDAAVPALKRLGWRPRGGDASWQCILRALLLTASPQTLQRLAPALVSALRPLVGDREREATLRLALLQLLDSVLEDPERGLALATGGGQALITEVLMPPLVWQAGKTAAAVRYAAVTALATLLGKRLPLPEHVLAAVESPAAAVAATATAATACSMASAAAAATGSAAAAAAAGSGLLSMLFSALDEDWYTDMRLAACYVMEKLLEMVGPQLSDVSRRALYPELHKRLDDAHNAVRVAACGALRALVSSSGPAYCDTNSGYLIAGVVIHMDDGDSAVQEAACSVLLAAAAVKPSVTAAEVGKVRDRFRSKHYCDRVLAACNEAAAAAVAT